MHPSEPTTALAEQFRLSDLPGDAEAPVWPLARLAGGRSILELGTVGAKGHDGLLIALVTAER